ncbi:MAG: sigma-54-dependent Fis family transcriptional regulator [Gemmatimonadetes bacterium]|nr:sigma-54-dependent Fis family transcriptional regulator [Gemmatimonadota bacterium]|tara:strand:- start:809 stop:2341 length:1533 start_codon:yes stop_codon:yes gene_type:complete
MGETIDRPAEALAILSDTDLSRDIRSRLEDAGWRTIVTNTIGPARKLLEKDRFGAVLLDAPLIEEADDPIGEAIARSTEPPGVILLGSTAHPPALRNLTPDTLLDLPPKKGELEAALQKLIQAPGRSDTEILGSSPAIEQVRQTVQQIAPTPVNVLITGESGTGKSLFARVIHDRSSRSRLPFLTLNCGSLPETLLESELFGHEKGAFTDARAQRQGLFETAKGGTVFLDEIGEMSLSAQVRLLHVLEQREITRLGSSTPIPVDVRVIAATNRDLQQAVAQGTFRRDLYYRLRVVEIEAPALRSIQQDIPVFAERFITRLSEEHSVPPISFDNGALSVLQSYAWPGNIRELRNLVERLMVLTVDRNISAHVLSSYLQDDSSADEGTENLPVHLGKTPEESSRDLLYWAILEVARDIKELKSYLMDSGSRQVPSPSLPVYQPHETPIEAGAEAEFSETGAVTQHKIKTMDEVEKEAIVNALQASDGHRKRAAELLDMAERTLYRKIRQYGL